MYKLLQTAPAKDLFSNDNVVSLLLGPQRAQDVLDAAKAPTERTSPTERMMALIADYETGRIERNDYTTRLYEQYKRKLWDKSRVWQQTVTASDGSSRVYVFKYNDKTNKVEVVDTVGTSGARWAPATYKALQDKYVQAIENVQMLNRMIKETPKEDVGGRINPLKAQIFDLFTSVFDPDFDPESDKTILGEKLVKGAVNQTKYQSTMFGYFSHYIRKDITGAQAAVKELEDLMNQLLSAKSGSRWKVIAQLEAYLRAQRSKAMLTYELLKREGPPNPNEALQYDFVPQWINGGANQNTATPNSGGEAAGTDAASVLENL